MHALVKGAQSGVVMVMVVLGLAGCGGQGSPSTSASSPTSGGWVRPDAPPDPRTLLNAGAQALAQVPDSALIFIQSQTDDVGTWKVQLVTPDGAEQQVKIASDGVSVLVGPTPVDSSAAGETKRRANVDGAHLDYRAAVERVLAAVPNGSITELGLLDVNGTIVWDADVWDTDLVEHDVTVNAASGAITANRQV